MVLIGDDDGADRGPAGWPMARRAVGWAAGILLHAVGAEISHYEAAIVAAEIVGRVLVIECSPPTLPAWTTLVQAASHRPSVLAIVPRGGVHPLPADRSNLQ